MTLPAAFSLIHSEFNAFLFATVAEQEDGIVVSVFSALTHSGADPWEEAARLSRLPAGLAVQALAPMLVQPPGDRDAVSAARESAARVVKLLPVRGPAIRTVARPSGPRRLGRPIAALLICLAIAASAILWLHAAERRPNDDPGASAPAYSTRSGQD